MPVYIEALEATKSSKHRGIRWTPHPAEAGCGCDGELVIDTDRCRCRYRVTEFPTAWAGRAFRLDKLDGSESYDVFVGADRRDDRCDCRGFERYGLCKHVDAVRALLDNRWLPDPRANPEADTGPTEAEDQELPECFRDLPALPVPGCPF
jgi:hypothetical protein